MPKLTPDDADRLFSSRVDERDLELGSLAKFVREVRETYTRAPDAQIQAGHLRAMAEEFAAVPPTAPARRPRTVLRRASIAGLVGSLLVGGSALAATGQLPTPAQKVIAEAVEHVGVKIPKARRASVTGQEKGDAGKARAAANRDRAKQFVDAKKLWTACVDDKARQWSGPGPFDPEAPRPAGCGPKPRAQDFQPTRTNPAGHENHGKGPAPKGSGPSGAAARDDVPGRPPSGSSVTPGPGNSGFGHGQGGGPAGRGGRQ